MPNYPDIQGFAYAFERGELTAAGRIITAIKGVQVDQPTEEGMVEGTRPFPLMRTPGKMGMGDGTVEFSDLGECQAFIDLLGQYYREAIWTLSWVLSAPRKPLIALAAHGCRVLADPVDHSSGNDALGGTIKFSFMYMTRNGKVAHRGLPTI